MSALSARAPTDPVQTVGTPAPVKHNRHDVRQTDRQTGRQADRQTGSDDGGHSAAVAAAVSSRGTIGEQWCA